MAEYEAFAFLNSEKHGVQKHYEVSGPVIQATKKALPTFDELFPALSDDSSAQASATDSICLIHSSEVHFWYVSLSLVSVDAPRPRVRGSIKKVRFHLFVVSK